MTTRVDFNLIAADYNAAERRLIMLDYDGTLVPFHNDPLKAKPDLRVTSILGKLAECERNDVLVISGRRREDLDDFLGQTNITLVAEHGGFYKPPLGDWRQTFAIIPDWINPVAKAIKALTFQHEGSSFEEKFYSVVWHYRAISSTLSEHERMQIIDAIRGLPDHGKFILDDNQHTMELRTPLVEKGVFFDWWCRDGYSFKLALGDGKTDEDLFRSVGKSNFTIRIGESSDSKARFHLQCQQDVLPFLTKLLLVNEEFERMKHSIGLDQENFMSI